MIFVLLRNHEIYQSICISTWGKKVYSDMSFWMEANHKFYDKSACYDLYVQCFIEGESKEIEVEKK